MKSKVSLAADEGDRAALVRNREVRTTIADLTGNSPAIPDEPHVAAGERSEIDAAGGGRSSDELEGRIEGNAQINVAAHRSEPILSAGLDIAIEENISD